MATDRDSKRRGTGEGFLLGELKIAPPLEEFRRRYEKKLRSFENSELQDLTPYREAFALGEEKIRRRLREGKRC